MFDDATKLRLESLLGDMAIEQFIRERIETGKERKDFAMVAANIARDRYSAGSTAAAAVLYIAAHHGIEAAINFVRDLEHHEH